MTNTTIGPQVERLAAVNELLLKQQKEECLDYKYDKTIKEMKETSWDSDVANGSEFKFISPLFFRSFISFQLQPCNGLIRHATNSAFIKPLTAKINCSAIVFHWYFSLSNALTFMASISMPIGSTLQSIEQINFTAR